MEFIDPSLILYFVIVIKQKSNEIDTRITIIIFCYKKKEKERKRKEKEINSAECDKNRTFVQLFVSQYDILS